MIATNPDFINGDKLNRKQYLAALINNKRLVYSSLPKCLRKVSSFWCVPLLVADAAFFVVLVYQSWKDGDGFDWLLIGALLTLIFIFFLPLAWAVSYYHSFVLPQKVTKKVTDFIDSFIPNATQVRGVSPSNYLLRWNDLEYEVAYSYIPGLNAKGKIDRYYESMLVCIYFIPDPAFKSEIADEKGHLLTDFVEQCNSYCKGKESCKNMRIANNTIYTMFRMNELSDKDAVLMSMEQMQYMTERFHLKPLYMSKSLGVEIIHWLQINDQPTQTDVVAFNIGIFETEAGYSLYLSGSKTYTPTDDDWACNDDFEPEEKYLEMPMTNHTSDDWKEFKKLAKSSVRKYLDTRGKNADSLFYHKIVTIGFDDGELEVVADGKEDKE